MGAELFLWTSTKPPAEEGAHARRAFLQPPCPQADRRQSFYPWLDDLASHLNTIEFERESAQAYLFCPSISFDGSPHIYSEREVGDLLSACLTLSPMNGLRPRTYVDVTHPSPAPPGGGDGFWRDHRLGDDHHSLNARQGRREARSLHYRRDAGGEAVLH